MMKLFRICIFAVLLLSSASHQAADAQEISSENPRIVSVDWGNSGHSLAVATQQDGLSIIDAFSQNVVARIPGVNTGDIRYAALSPDERLIATIGNNPSVNLWDAMTGQLVNHLEGIDFGVNLAWSSDSRLLIMGKPGDIPVWDVSDNQTLFTIPGSPEDIPMVAFSETGKVALSWSAKIEIWDVATQQMIRRIQPSGLRSSIQWSSDGNRLLVSNTLILLEKTSYLVQILDAETGGIIQEYEGFPAAFTSAQWSPDETQILTTSDNGKVGIIDVESGITTLILESDAPVFSADWSPYGGQIVVGMAIGSTNRVEGDAVQSADNLNNGLNILVPMPSVKRLQAIANACQAPTSIKQTLADNIQSDQLVDFAAQIKALPEGTIPTACAADLVAVARALT